MRTRLTAKPQSVERPVSETDDHEIDIFARRLGERLARLGALDDVMMRRRRPHHPLKRALLVINEQDAPSLGGLGPQGFDRSG
jgi:hypothetical protein